MGLLGGPQEKEEGGMGAVGDAGNDQKRGSENGGGRQPLAFYDSGSDSESGAETDDEASSTSDYPLHLGSGLVGVAAPSKTRDTSSPRDNGESTAMVEKASHLDISKECPPLGTSVTSPSVSNLPMGTSAVASPSIPTIQLPVQSRGSSGEESDGGNEPDVSASVSESEGNAPLVQSSDRLRRSQNEALLQPSRKTRDHGNDPNHSESDESENSSSESVEEEVEQLSRQNKLHRPHRDKVGGADGDKDDVQSDSLSITTTTMSNSYLYGENASDRVRHLVKRSVSKKKQERQRKSRPKKETKAPSAMGRRSKKLNRTVVKQTLDTSIF